MRQSERKRQEAPQPGANARAGESGGREEEKGEKNHGANPEPGQRDPNGTGWGDREPTAGPLTEAEEEGVHAHAVDAEEAVGDQVGAHDHRLQERHHCHRHWQSPNPRSRC